MAAAVELRGITKAFGGTLALSGVDLTVTAGEIHALVGENGAGKSTLMKVLSGALRPDAGSIALDGKAYAPRTAGEGRSAGVAMIYQELSIAPHLPLWRNISLGAELSRRGMLRIATMRKRAADALAALGHGALDIDAPASALTIAERQIVEIARALSAGCIALVLDEPTSSLTPTDTRTLFEVLRRLRSQGTAIIYISHFLEEVMEISDRYTVLRDGQVAGSGMTAGTGVDTLIQLMVGKAMGGLYIRSHRTPGEPLLEVRDLAGRSLPRSASLTLRRGEILGIAGLVGAGRTEFLRALFGLDPVCRGTIRIGVHSGPGAPDLRWLQGTGMLSEDRGSEGLALPLSIAQNITMGMRRGIGPWGWYSPTRLQQAAGEWCTRLAIKSASLRPVATLSGGNQQKVALARLLYEEVDLLLMDEPTRGIDVGSKEEIYRLLDRLASGDGGMRTQKGILLVSSYLPELLGVCDRIAVMARGVLGAARPVGEWDQHALLSEATSQGVPA